MKEKMIRFLTDLGFEDAERFDMDFLQTPTIVNKVVVFDVIKQRPWQSAELEEFKEKIAKINYTYEFRFSYQNPPLFQDVIELYDNWYLTNFYGISPFKLIQEDSSIRIETTRDNLEKATKVGSDFSDFLSFVSYPFYIGEPVILEIEKPAVEKVIATEEPKEEISLKVEAAVEEITNPAEEDTYEPEEEFNDVEPDSQTGSEDNLTAYVGDSDFSGEIIYDQELLEEAHRLAYELKDLEDQVDTISTANRKSRFKGDYSPVKDIRAIYKMSMGNVEFTGQVFNINSRLTKKGQLFLTFSIADDRGAINCRAISSKNGLTEEVLNGVKELGRYQIQGALEYDSKNADKQIFVHYMNKLDPKPLRNDPEIEKRVELHLHTKMSQMDGLGDIENYCAVAKNMGMKALAVTDHGVLQSFPAAERAGSATGIKIIYGCELYVFDYPIMVVKPTGQNLRKARYCVFDFETTGLSHTYDRPIEFGCVIVENGMVMERHDIFINPGMKISESAQRINHITNEELVDKPTMEVAIHEINKIIEGCILVSHNAPFDISFLNMMRKAAGQPPVDNTVIDTLAVAEYIYPEFGYLNEGTLAKKLDVQLGDDATSGAFHRADYDSEILSRVWMVMINELSKQLGKHDVFDVELENFECHHQNFYKHIKAFHVCVLVKNYEGLKALYRIVSESETTFLSAGSVPKVPRQFLNENRENLIVGSACMNGFVFEKALNGTQDELEEEMEFYDYIEIQPKENYSWLIGMEDCTEERLMDVLRRIVATADKKGKLLCATGDCHYVNPEDKILRDIYIVAPGLGGSFHPLNPSKRKNHAPFDNPDQHFRSTAEMLASFRTWLPEEKCREIVITNTNLIAERTEPLKILKDTLSTPDANLPGSDEKLRTLCYANLKKNYGENPDPLVKERLEKELEGIIGHGYSVTYYIAHLLVKHAAEEGYFVGSRGSVGSSFAATMAEITEVNPLKPHYLCPHCKHFEWADKDPRFKNLRSGFDLPHKNCPECGTEMIREGQSIPFETFLGFEADKVPDIDLNFPQDYQARAHAYTRTLLSTPEENEKIRKGEFIHNPHVIRAGTIAAAEAKNAYGYVKRYYEKVYDIKDLPAEERPWAAWLAMRCSGVKRTTGQHPGGIVVIPANMDIFDFTPFQHPADDPNAEWLTTHYEFASMHDSVLKLDELGHVDPMALRMQCLLTGIDINHVADVIPVDDPAVLSLFTSPKALKMKTNPLDFKTGAIALPEFGTNFVQGLLEEAKPKTFNDLLIISGLSHGTNVWNSNAQDLIRSGKVLEQVIGCRDDIMNYLISMNCDPNMSFHAMEDVRKARKLKPEYQAQMRAHGVPEWYIESCNKIQYLFPRAHATAYVIGALRVAWFKIYHPLAFYATYFTTRCDKFDIAVMSGGVDKIKEQILDLRHRSALKENFSDVDAEILKTDMAAIEMVDRGYIIENVNLMESKENEWTVCKERNSIIPPFTVISGFGAIPANKIMEARKNGEFLSVDDLRDRSGIGESTITALRNAGALDGLSESNQMTLF
ncbi:MAG: PolC-type DNA polymerase III [Bacilli bacterium]|nr:PolC-type DNA polymerase III [Bacilli bacterium]